jgi:hypothetical protein
MKLKPVSYVMIGLFALALAATAVGSAQVLLGS